MFHQVFLWISLTICIEAIITFNSITEILNCFKFCKIICRICILSKELYFSQVFLVFLLQSFLVYSYTTVFVFVLYKYFIGWCFLIQRLWRLYTFSLFLSTLSIALFVFWMPFLEKNKKTYPVILFCFDQ